MNPVNEERAAANSQIDRTMKAWRAASGGAVGKPSVPKGAGAPLPTPVRSKMEPKLGASLGNVRVHTGGESADAAKGFGARAFTVGEDVHFNAGEFNPGTKEGDKLLAHELTHVVQGQKSGIQRKAEEGEEKKEGGGGGGDAAGGADAAGGDAAGGAEVSDPNEAAEKEADATGDQVGEELHGGGDEKKGGKDKKKDAAKDKDKKKKGGDAGADAKGGEQEGGEKEGEEGGGDKQGAEGGGGGGGEAKAEEKPAPIAAKLEGYGFWKIFRAPNPNNLPPAQQPTLQNSGNLNVNANTTRTQSPLTFAGSKGKYDSSFTTVKNAVMGQYQDPAKKAEAGQKFEAKRDDWYTRWGNVVLSQNGGAANAVFPAIEAEAKAMLPDDAPAAGGGHLYSGQAGGQRGRAQAEAHAAANPVGNKPGTLETTNMGKLFDDVASANGRDKPYDQWLPWNDTAQQWWSTISASYAKTLRGEISAHVCVGFSYQMMQKIGKPKSQQDPQGITKAQATARSAEIDALRKLPDNVFSNAELDQVTKLMETGDASLKVHLRLEVAPNNVLEPPDLVITAGNARQQIEDKIKTLVTVQAMLAYYPA